MRHRKLRNQLGRPTEHRIATLRNLAAALIEHEKIRTTISKAKALRPVIEKMVTKAKEDTTHHRRLVFADLGGKKTGVTKLFEVYGPRFVDRPGGYTRIVQDSPRAGDGAPMAIIEFVDREFVVESQEDKEAKMTREQRARAYQRQRRKEIRRTP